MSDRIKLRIALVIGASFALSGIFENFRHSIQLSRDHDHDVGFAPTVQNSNNTLSPTSRNTETDSSSQATEYVNYTKLEEEREARLKKEWAFEILDEAVLNQKEICFISCAYGHDVKKLDRLIKLTNKSPHVKFFLYTNLNDEQWKTPGWEKVITNFTYRRRITHSRYGKFLGWKNEKLQKNCDAIFYVDSSIRPRLDLQTLNDIAVSLNDTKYGFYQHVHKRSKSGIIREFGVIQLFKKDIDENINASIAWMETQPDYNPRSPLFLNQCMAYLPGSKTFQQVSSAFWERYSQELDSWRDQPLWAFMLHRYNITPDIFAHNHTELWEVPHPKKFGHNKHMYFSEDDVRMFDKPKPTPIVQKKVEPDSSDEETSDDEDSSDEDGTSDDNESPKQAKTVAPTVTGYVNHTRIMEEREARLKKEWAFEILDEAVPNQKEICFISCAYGHDVKKLDRLVKLTNRSPHVKFYLYTNLNDEQWKTPGWEKVITNFTYRRRITHSRYGKFLGWKNEKLQKNCDAIFYADSSIRPRLDLQTMNDIAISLNDTKYGFYQHLHKRSKSGIIREFGVIQLFKKDIDENINASIAWMETQPDYNPRSPLFLNQCMAYLPGSKTFQKVSSAFWERYSQELDSWRDQPLWAFMLHRYNITPDIFPQNHTELWEVPHPKKFGHNKHMYYSEEDVKF